MGGVGEDLDRARELRERGLTPKEIARAIGLPPARVTHMVRKIAAAQTADPTQRPGLPRIVHDFFAVFGERPVAAPLEPAQHLVFGAAEYARRLGFEPAAESDFAATRGHLGSWDGPSAIGFGRHGKPCFISGPHDDAGRVVRQLERSVGVGNFDYVIGMPG